MPSFKRWRAMISRVYETSRRAEPRDVLRTEIFRKATEISAKSYRHRMELLQGYGLVREERRILAAVIKDTRSLRGPTMQFVLEKRRDMYLAARDEAWRAGVRNNIEFYNLFQRRIYNWYREQGWLSFGRLDPLKMLKWFRKQYDLDSTPQRKPKTKQPRTRKTIREARSRSRRGE